MTRCDLIVSGARVLTMDENSSEIDSGSVAISQGRIVALGGRQELAERFTPGRVIDAGQSLVMPGMINTHTHAAMSYFRGLADDLDLSIWLEKHIWPAEARYVSRAFVRDATELACLEMLRAGITCYNDMYFFARESAEVSSAIGIRSLLGETLVSFPAGACKDYQEALSETESLLSYFAGNDLVSISLNIHSVYACDGKCLEAARDFSQKHGLGVHVHVSETKKEVRESKEKTGLSPVGYLDRIGLLSGRTVAAHAVWLSPEDIQILVEKKVKISHNPVSNMKLASGLSPVAELLARGLDVGLGTDSAASNNTLDLFSEMRTAALIHKGFSLDSKALPAVEIVRMATINAAKVLGLDREIGSLEVGKKADLITLSLDKPHLVPLFSPYSHLVYAANSADIENVVINGKVIMENKEITAIDEAEVIRKARLFSQDFIKSI